MERTSLSLAVLVIAGLSGPALALDELQWLAPDADRVAALTTAPAECLAMPTDPEQARLVALGRVAFRSPVLLGGLAARSGMSCDTCHRNGHGNPAFFIAGVSGAPGTADVTSALFSQTRGDGIFNPVPIPDLTGAAGKSRFGTMRPAGDLHSFVHAVAVDEFQGKEPIPAVADGLVAYVAALKTSACPAKATTTITFQSDAAELGATYTTLLRMLDHGDQDTAEFLLLSLNAALGKIAQRFPKALETRGVLQGLGQDLNRIRRLFREDKLTFRRSLIAWRANVDAEFRILSHLTKQSLYNADSID